MRTRILITMALPMLAVANPWFITGGIGYGQHESDASNTAAVSQSHWHLMSSVSSALYEGMDGRLSYDIAQGSYEDATVADNNISIDFRAHMIQSNYRMGAGLGLGFNNRVQGDTLNQAYVPLYFDIQTVTGSWNKWRVSMQGDYFVHPPNADFLYGFNPILSRLETGLHYQYNKFEFSTIYQIAKFSNDTGVHGLNTKRIEAQIHYHWSPYT